MQRASIFRGFLAAALLAGSAFGQTFSDVGAIVGLNVPANGFGYRGCAWADFDLDNDMDCFMPETGLGPTQIFLNNGTTFTASIVEPGSTIFQNTARTVIAADIDNDGDDDVFVARQNQPNQLWINDGTGSFTNEATARGVDTLNDSFSATFGDFDRDGWIDLYVGMYGPFGTGLPNVLFRNDGDGTFTDVTAAAGVASPGQAFAVCFADYNGDQWPDLWVMNDNGTGLGQPVALFKNRGNGTFTDVSAATNVNAPADGMGFTIGDIHNDGGWDVFITNIPPSHVMLEYNAATVGYNFQGGNFSATATAYGVNSGLTGWGCGFFDYDNDGLLDLYVTHSTVSNRLYKGTPGTAPFTDVGSTTGYQTNAPTGFGSCTVDYDSDGNVDTFITGTNIITSSLMKNPGFNSNNWVKLNLVGTVSNSSGVGAVVIVRSALGDQKRQVTVGDSFLCSNDRRPHFGLGGDTVINEVEVRWPSGTVQYLNSVPINQVVNVVEPQFVMAGPLTPGSTNSVFATISSDIGLNYISALTIDTTLDYQLPDGRAIRTNINDPLIALSTQPANPNWINFTGPLSGPIANMTLNLPNVPITGFPFSILLVTADPAYPGGVKSILGPEEFIIQ